MPRVPKTPVRVELPPVLAEFLRHVAERIVAKDSSTTIESDDLLQCECAYGGLDYRAGDRFNFRFFPDEDSSATWNIQLDSLQIVDVAQGWLKSLDLWRCSGKACGCLYATEDSYCTHCDTIRHFEADYAERMRKAHPEQTDATIDSMAHLRRIAQAVGDYMHENNGRMPPPFTSDGNGNRLHSWRSLILPFMDLDELHAAIDFDEPWDAPVNREVAARFPNPYQSAGATAGHTRYMAIVEQFTLWPPDAVRLQSDVTSGLSKTICVVEAPDSFVNWMEPQDISFDALAGQVALSGRPMLATLMDGNVALLSDLDEHKLRQLATI